MTLEQKAQIIEERTAEMLEVAKVEMRKAIKKAINSGAIDIDGWDPSYNPAILPKVILIAVLETEADQYKATGTSFEKQVKKEVKNLKLFL